MRVGALAPYEQALRGDGPLALHRADGSRVVMDVGHWLGPASGADLPVLDRCRGPVLDIGCGPGRVTAALAERGIASLGIDITPLAVEFTRRRRVAALVRDVFAGLPGEGRWPTVLLLDGNVGIGGDVDELLARTFDLLRPGGRLIAEADPDDAVNERCLARFAVRDTVTGPPFPWSFVGAPALRRQATAVGYRVEDDWSDRGRRFLSLRR